MSAPDHTMVRMGELAVTTSPDEVLVAIGLGSCIGLTVVDRQAGVVGLAHIMLPGRNGPGSSTAGDAKYADVAVERLVEMVVGAGAAARRLESILVGGARMFAGQAGGLDIGARNEEATRQALGAALVPVRAHATAGNRGRTVRVHTAPFAVRVKEAGGTEVTLYP